MNIGIIGAGPSGRAIASGLRGTGAVLLADRHPDRAKAAAAAIAGGVTATSLDEALEADIVVLALTSPETVRFARENATGLLGKVVVAIDHALAPLAEELPLSTVIVASDAERAKSRVTELIGLTVTRKDRR